MHPVSRSGKRWFRIEQGGWWQWRWREGKRLNKHLGERMKRSWERENSVEERSWDNEITSLKEETDQVVEADIGDMS